MMSLPAIPVAGRAAPLPLPPAVAPSLGTPLSAGLMAAVSPLPAVPPFARAIPSTLHVSGRNRVSLPHALITATAAAVAFICVRIFAAAPVPVLVRRPAHAIGLLPTPGPAAVPVPAPIVQAFASAALVLPRWASPFVSLVWPLIAWAAMAVFMPVPVAFRQPGCRRSLMRALGRGLRGL